MHGEGGSGPGVPGLGMHRCPAREKGDHFSRKACLRRAKRLLKSAYSSPFQMCSKRRAKILPKLNDQVDKDDFGHAGRRSHGGQEAKSSMLSFIMKKRCAGGQ
jgi:hypothetical protein